MRNRQTQGGVSALICASSFIVGLVLILLVAPDFNDGPDERLRTLSKFSGFFQLWYFLIYVVFGVCLLILSIALLEPIKREHRPLEQITTLASYLWACYIFASGFIAIFSIEFLFANHFDFSVDMVEMWRDIYTVQMALGEGVEWVGGIWVILINTCLYLEKRFRTSVVYFGFFASFFGLLTLKPEWQEMGAIFGILQVVWFIWIGILLLREKKAS